MHARSSIHTCQTLALLMFSTCRAKLLPSDAVRRAYRDARSAGKLEEFWAARGGVPEWAAGQLASKTA